MQTRKRVQQVYCEIATAKKGFAYCFFFLFLFTPRKCIAGITPILCQIRFIAMCIFSVFAILWNSLVGIGIYIGFKQSLMIYFKKNKTNIRFSINYFLVYGSSFISLPN